MKICLAQIRPTLNQIERNIHAHLISIELAVKQGADVVVFSELSITGYTLEYAKTLAMNYMDERLDVFQDISDRENITLLMGAPLHVSGEIQIGMIVFQPNQLRSSYSKQWLHADEEPYFSRGKEPLLLTVKNKTLALAICFEALQKDHLEQSIQLGADIYIASVAKPQKGIDKAQVYFPKASQKYALPILMVNAIGKCDGFTNLGQSSVWNHEGVLLAELNNNTEELLIYATEDDTIKRIVLVC